MLAAYRFAQARARRSWLGQVEQPAPAPAPAPVPSPNTLIGQFVNVMEDLRLTIEASANTPANRNAWGAKLKSAQALAGQLIEKDDPERTVILKLFDDLHSGWFSRGTDRVWRLTAQVALGQLKDTVYEKWKRRRDMIYVAVGVAGGAVLLAGLVVLIGFLAAT